jgi:CheY-like chemotaxis protein
MEDAGGRLDVGLAEVDIKPETDAALPPPGKYARLTVSDTGAGIDKAVLSRIFEPYFTTKDKDRGTGLGLALVHGIVKSYGGEITVETEIGKGTTFNIFLPCGEQESAEEVIDAINAVQSGSESILLVDDEEPIVRMEKQMLERLGYHVTARTGSLEALDAFKADPDGFDAVITDLTMPNLTGDKLAAALMEIRPDLPVILCTGFSEKLSRVKAANLGIKGYLMKPVIKSEIAALLRDVLSASRK